MRRLDTVNSSAIVGEATIICYMRSHAIALRAEGSSRTGIVLTEFAEPGIISNSHSDIVVNRLLIW